MEENNSIQEKTGNNKNMVVTMIVIIAIIVLVISAGYYYMNNQKQKAVVENQVPTPILGEQETGVTSESQPSSYKDGTYTAEGTYSYHSGTEKIGVTVTLANGQIQNVTIEKMAVAPASVKMQEDFEANYKTLVVGKNINEIKLGKVSGSSLTPEGFNEALEQIKTQASQS